MSKIKKGDSVVVRNGVMEPDFEEFELSGWQGRVVEIGKDSDKNNVLITIEWDSITLAGMPGSYIEQSESEGLVWHCMVLYESDLDITNPRDTKKDTKKMQDKLSEKYQWASLEEEGSRIAKVLEGVDLRDEMDCLERWFDYLEENIKFPVSAVVVETDEYSPYEIGDIVSMKSLSSYVDLYGIIASIRISRKKYEVPLCLFEVADKTSEEYQLINDYNVWFANR